jgi:hypothetical protein
MSRGIPRAAGYRPDSAKRVGRIPAACPHPFSSSPDFIRQPEFLEGSRPEEVDLELGQRLP